MSTLGKILAIIGIIIMAFSTIGSIGYGLYLWGSVGLALSSAAWAAFVVWMKMIMTGLTLAVVGFFMVVSE